MTAMTDMADMGDLAAMNHAGPMSGSPLPTLDPDTGPACPGSRKIFSFRPPEEAQGKNFFWQSRDRPLVTGSGVGVGQGDPDMGPAWVTLGENFFPSGRQGPSLEKKIFPWSLCMA